MASPSTKSLCKSVVTVMNANINSNEVKIKGGVVLYKTDELVTILTSNTIFHTKVYNEVFPSNMIKVKFFDEGNYYDSNVMVNIKPLGLCILSVTGKNTKHVNCAVINENELVVGNPVTCISHPLNELDYSYYTTTTGVVCNIGRFFSCVSPKDPLVDPSVNLLQCNYHCGYSAEGGPLFNNAGEFVGVHVGHNKTFNFSFVVSTSILRDHLRIGLNLEGAGLYDIVKWMTRSSVSNKRKPMDGGASSSRKGRRS